jgi:tetratricopeptide (TPR) repeat protein
MTSTPMNERSNLLFEGQLSMRILLALCVTLFAISFASVASAQEISDDERARSHFAAGTSYYDQHRYSEAADQFMEAYRLSHRGALLLNAASSYERALDHAHAAEVLQRYLDEQPEATDRATVEGRLAEAQRLAAEETARAEALETHDETPPVAATDDGIGTLGIVGISVGAVGVLAGIGAIITGVIALDTHASLEARCGAGGTMCPPGYEADVDTGSSMALANSVLLPVSLVALAAGTTLLIIDLTDGPSGESVAFLPGPGDVGLSTRITF